MSAWDWSNGVLDRVHPSRGRTIIGRALSFGVDGAPEFDSTYLLSVMYNDGKSVGCACGFGVERCG
jgi:hypothetical protein